MELVAKAGECGRVGAGGGGVGCGREEICCSGNKKIIEVASQDDILEIFEWGWASTQIPFFLSDEMNWCRFQGLS